MSWAGDEPKDCRILLFVDAGFAGDLEDSKSTSGAYLVLQGPPPMGQKLYIYPTVPLICCLQTSRQQLYISQLLNVLSYDEQYVYVQDPESEQTHTLTHEFVKTSCRSAHAYTIASCQGRQYTGTIALWDTKHAKYSKRHAYTALSRSRSYAALSIED